MIKLKLKLNQETEIIWFLSVCLFLQRHLESAVHLYKRRVDWLSVGCRRIFGTVVEKR